MITPQISNLDFPVAALIRKCLHQLQAAQQAALLEKMSEDEFIMHRVDIYLESLECAQHAGLDESGATEVALQDCLNGLSS